MVELKVRAKHLGEWVEGYFCVYCGVPQMLVDELSWEPIDDIKTVGRYTGLCDKSGHKIFEGDIVKTQPFYDRPYSNKRKSKQFIGIVKYKTRIFNGNDYHSKQCYHGEWGLEFNEDFGEYNYYDWGELWDCEVIGNEWDNPELLK